MKNVISYESPGINYIDAPLSNKDKTTPQQIILGLKGLTEETKDKNIFISIKKDYYSNFIISCKKKYSRDTSVIVDFLLAVMAK